ncbi:MAG: hypothetical protein JXN60_06910 [Lentisphaerae bacterium]|nr:hypothetical protein [Lentisphaerota bacterium]
MSAIYMMMGAVIIGLSVWVIILQDQLTDLHRRYPGSKQIHVLDGSSKGDYLPGASKTWVVDVPKSHSSRTNNGSRTC